MSDEPYDTPEGKNVLQVLSNAVNYVGNEALILIQYQMLFEDTFPPLGLSDNNDD